MPPPPPFAPALERTVGAGDGSGSGALALVLEPSASPPLLLRERFRLLVAPEIVPPAALVAAAAEEEEEDSAAARGWLDSTLLATVRSAATSESDRARTGVDAIAKAAEE